MTTIDHKETGQEATSVNSALASHAGEWWTENGTHENRSERVAEPMEPASPAGHSAFDRGQETKGVGGRFGDYARWRRQVRGGTLRSRALGAIQSEPTKTVRPVYGMSEDEKKR